MWKQMIGICVLSLAAIGTSLASDISDRYVFELEKIRGPYTLQPGSVYFVVRAQARNKSKGGGYGLGNGGPPEVARTDRFFVQPGAIYDSRSLELQGSTRMEI